MIKSLLKRMVGALCYKIHLGAEWYEAEDYKRRLLACGSNVRIARGCMLIPEHMIVGSNVVIGARSCIMASISYVNIGNNVVMGPDVCIHGGDHRVDILGKYIIEVSEKEKLPENDKDVTICDDVWIGQGAVILKGVTIGEGSVIGAGSIVTKSIPPYTVYVGSHSPMERPRFNEEQIRQHKRLLEQRQVNHNE